MPPAERGESRRAAVRPALLRRQSPRQPRASQRCSANGLPKAEALGMASLAWLPTSSV